MASREFEGRTALVTGGSRGIGREVCLALAGEGARIAVNYAGNEAAAERTAADVRALGPECRTYRADVSDLDAVRAMVAAVERDLGPVDLLVTSAGISGVEDPGDLGFGELRRMMAVNVDGTFLPVMALKDGMIERGFGRIVCIASIAGLRSRPHNIVYSATKAAVISLVRSWAKAFAPAVRVNCVAPGLIETDMTEHMDPDRKRAMIEATALGRIGQPQEMAQSVLFLLSERASFTNGQTLVSDGGRVILP